MKQLHQEAYYGDRTELSHDTDMNIGLILKQLHEARRSLPEAGHLFTSTSSNHHS